MFTKLQLTKQMTQTSKMSLRVRVAREINYHYENERKQWGLEMKKYRLKHKEEFWNTQT